MIKNDKIKTLKTLKISLSLIALFFVAIHAQAESSIESTFNTLSTKSESKSSWLEKLNVTVGTEVYSNTQSDSSIEHESGQEFVADVVYKLDKNYTLGAKQGISQVYTGAHMTSASNTTLKLSRLGFELNPETKTTHALIGVLPVNEEQRTTTSFQGAMGIANGIAFNSPKLIALWSMGLIRNIHEYTISAEGAPNLEYAVNNTFAITVPLAHRFSISSDYTQKNGWTYHGYTRSAYAYNADLIYTFDNKISLNIGTSNENALIKNDVKETTIKVFDSNTSIFRLGLTWTTL